MKAERATDRPRMKHGSKSVFHPCSIRGWASFRTLPAHDSVLPAPRPYSQTCATPTTYEEWSGVFETTEHKPFAGKGLRRRHGCATQTEKLRRRCALRIFAVRRPALRRNRADLLRPAQNSRLQARGGSSCLRPVLILSSSCHRPAFGNRPKTREKGRKTSKSRDEQNMKKKSVGDDDRKMVDSNMSKRNLVVQ
jgi:hypothetical protein